MADDQLSNGNSAPRLLRFRIVDLFALTAYVASICAAIRFTSRETTTVIVIAACIGIFFYRSQIALARITFWTVIGAVIGLIAGGLMIAIGNGPYVFAYRYDLRMLIVAESSLLFSSVYGSVTSPSPRYLTRVVAGHFVGVMLGMSGVLGRIPARDERPHVLVSVVICTAIVTILSACFGAWTNSVSGRTTPHAR